MAEQEATQPEATAQDQSQESTAPEAVQPEEIAGVGIVVIGYTQEDAADQVLQSMKQAMKQGTFYYEDAAVVRQDSNGKVHIQETEDMSTGKGAGIGAVVGGLLGLLGGPAGVALGAGVGAGIGGGLAHHDAGFRNEGLKDVGAALRPATSALVVTTSKVFIEQVRKQVPAAELADVSRRIAQDISDSLAAGKDMALGMLFTEKGLAVKEIRVDDESAEVFGFVVTDEGVAAGAAVVTAEGAAYEVAAETAEGAVYEAGVIVPEDEAAADAGADDAAAGTSDDDSETATPA